MTLVYAQKKKSTHPEKKHKKHSSPSKQKRATEKKHKKALTMIPAYGTAINRIDRLMRDPITSSRPLAAELPSNIYLA